MVSRRLWAGALLVALGLVSCRSASPPATTIQQATEAPIRVSGSGAAVPLVQKLAEAYQRQQPGATFTFDTGTNTGGGIQGVVQGTLDLSVANRPFTEEEATQGLVVHPFARDAVVFASAAPSAVSGLTTAEAKAIYAGTDTDWRQLGAPEGQILVLDRDQEEPQRSLFLLKLLDGQPVQARTTVLTSVGDMLQAIRGTPNGVGYTILSVLHVRQIEDVQVLTLDGVVPNKDTVRTGTYPWSLTYTLINRPDAPPALDRFLGFIASPDGRQVLDQYDAVAAQS